MFKRTYAREVPETEGRHEEWHETVARVVEGTFSMQRRWQEAHSLPWDHAKATDDAEEMYRRMFTMKFLPPGRGLWAMGSPLTESRHLYAALNNCGFVSTSIVDKCNPARPFCFLMDASMLGVGVGFDTKGAGLIHVDGLNSAIATTTVQVEDSREGWIDIVRQVINAHMLGHGRIKADMSLIRPMGSPIRSFGGKASGPGPLIELLDSIESLLSSRSGNFLTVTDIVDIMNLIGRCVISGNVRRTAEIAFGDPDLEEYLDLKNYQKNPDREEFGWTSNNSVFARLGMDYSSIVDRIRSNGEPGLCWMDNMQAYSRMSDPKDFKDSRATGGNPCLEQTLESYELCCLVETFPNKHESLEDFKETLRLALLYAKTVTLGETHWKETNTVMMRNRRIGCSMSGIAQFITQRGLGELHNWCKKGYSFLREYDSELSDRFCVRESIKLTSIKPSGTVSLLAGATPGMHYPESRFYLRRVRVSSNSELIAPLRAAGYPIEVAVGQSDTMVVEIPVDCGDGIRTVSQVSLWEQLALAAFLQAHWADNQVSCTVTFDNDKVSQSELTSAIGYYQYQLKGVSFLPRIKHGAFEQMPYEEISEKEYNSRLSTIGAAKLSNISRHESDFELDRFCDSPTCSGSIR